MAQLQLTYLTDKYKVLQKLGSGGQASTFVAQHTRENRTVVIKMVICFDDDSANAALIEAKHLRKIRHANVVQFEDVFLQNIAEMGGNRRAVCIVMELCNWGDLAKYMNKHLIQAKKSVSETKAIKWLLEIACALTYLHRKKVVHRDMKAQNCFITDRDVIKLGDFGVAKRFTAEESSFQGRIGTPGYISPEIHELRPFGKANDVWGFGCIAYELLMNVQIWNRPQEQWLCSTVEENPITAEHLPSRYPLPLRALIATCLLFDPDTRPTAKECAIQLKGMAEARNVPMDHDAVNSALSSGKRDSQTKDEADGAAQGDNENRSRRTSREGSELKKGEAASKPSRRSSQTEITSQLEKTKLSASEGERETAQLKRETSQNGMPDYLANIPSSGFDFMYGNAPPPGQPGRPGSREMAAVPRDGQGLGKSSSRERGRDGQHPFAAQLPARKDPQDNRKSSASPHGGHAPKLCLSEPPSPANQQAGPQRHISQYMASRDQLGQPVGVPMYASHPNGNMLVPGMPVPMQPQAYAPMGVAPPGQAAARPISAPMYTPEQIRQMSAMGIRR